MCKSSGGVGVTLGTNRKSAFNVAAKAARRMQRGRVERRAAVWIWLIAVSGFVAAGLVGWWQWESAAAIDSPLAWWGLLIAFYASEWLVIAMRYGGRPLVFTMSAVPLVVGLLAVAPVELVAVIALSTVVFAGSRRREPLVMLVLLIGRRLLEAATAIVVFRLVGQVAEPFGPTGWLVAIAAVVAAYVLGHGLATLAISIQGVASTSGRQHGGLRVRCVHDDGERCAGHAHCRSSLLRATSSSLCCRPCSGFVRGVPGLCTFPAGEAQAAFPVRSNTRSARIASVGAFARCRSRPRSGHVRFTSSARSSCNSEPNAMCSAPLLGPKTTRRPWIPSELDRWRLVWDQAEADERPFVIDRSGSLASSAGDRRLPIVAAMVAPILVGESHIGIIVVANPLDDAALFSKADLELLALLAEQVGVAVDNGQTRRLACGIDRAQG